MDASAYPFDMTVAGATAFLAGVSNSQKWCSESELAAFNSEVGKWQAPIPPTYSTAESVPVAAACAESLVPLRSAIETASKDASPLYGLLEAASCTPAEKLVVRLREVEPHLRRQGVLPTTAVQNYQQ